MKCFKIKDRDNEKYWAGAWYSNRNGGTVDFWDDEGQVFPTIVYAQLAWKQRPGWLAVDLSKETHFVIVEFDLVNENVVGEIRY